MIEQGIVELVQADPTVAALCPVGGFLSQLPQTATLPSWAYSTISLSRTYPLDNVERLTMRRIQIDVIASTSASVIHLANAIDAVLSGYRGTLPDPDATAVQGIFTDSMSDFFDTTARNYRRSIDYIVWYAA
jgi:hypothetical protein